MRFWKAGHPGTLFTALLYFDFCFAIWVLNAAMAPFISEELALSPAEKGLMMSVPVVAGALLRLPMGIIAQVLGRSFGAVLAVVGATALAAVIASWTVEEDSGRAISGVET